MTTLTKNADPLEVASENYTVLLENDRVRVLDIHIKPGDKIAMHGHPDVVVYALSDVDNRFEFADGTSQEFRLRKGDTLFHEAFSHAAENMSKEASHLLVVELK